MTQPIETTSTTNGEELARNATTINDLEASAFTDFWKHIFSGIGHLFTPEQKKELSTTVTDFVTSDIGRLAVDSVEWVKTALPNASGVEKRDAAVAKLKADAAAAGKDLSALATSLLNLFIELALQYVLAKGATLVTGL